MAADYEKLGTLFTQVKAQSPNGPYETHRFYLPAGSECEEMEEGYENVAESAGRYFRQHRCNHCQEVLDGTAGRSILLHLKIRHGIENPIRPESSN